MLPALIVAINMLLNVLFYIIVIQAILSWLIAFNVINTQNDLVRSFLRALDWITAPLYRPIRAILPDFGGIDFSPLVILLAIKVIQVAILPELYRMAVT